MSDIQQENFSFAGYFAEILQTKEVRNAVDSGITEVLNQWGNGSSTKRIMLKPAKWAIKKSLSDSSAGPEKKELLTLLKNPDILEYAGSVLPDICNNITEIIHAAVLAIEEKPEEKKRELISQLYSSVNPEKIGSIITSLARTADSVLKHNPELLSEMLLPALRSLIETTDFSAFKNLFDNSKEDIDRIISGVNDLGLEYPAKLVTLLSFLPGTANHLIFFLEDFVQRFNELPADILTDIVLSFFKEIDDESVGRLINNVNELIRQIHTGSALIGEAGSPQFPTEFLKKARVIMDQVDPELMLKAGNAVTDSKETVQKVLQSVIAGNPETLVRQLETISSCKNSRLRVIKHKLEMIEDLDEEKAAEALAAGISTFNAYDVADVVNSACILANSVNEQSPGVLTRLIRDFLSSLDFNEIEECLDWGCKELGREFKPLIRSAAPAIVKELIGCLAPENDGNDDRIAESRDLFYRFVSGNHQN